ncbi:MAG: dTDP-4-dehydrorhamnose reductase [Saprospiraceae bacterium]|nr:dTDP-4-dehydrorhamnose reductase [Saprospiraceae bacterium]
MPIKILVNGAHGQLGQELKAIEEQYPQIHFSFYTKEEWDVCSEIDSANILADAKAHYLIHAAAYTRVDQAETQRDECFKINCQAAESIARFCYQQHTRMIYISSDYVFFKDQPGLICEDEPKNPKGVYAESKSQGEDLVLKTHPESIIIRTSWLYSSFGHNFVKTMLNLGKNRNTLNIVNDQTGSPTYARNLAHALASIATQTAGKSLNQYQRILHFSDEGTCTWLEFATEIFKYKNIQMELNGISTEKYGAPAPRPHYSSLDCSRIAEQFFVFPKNWKVALHECLDCISDNY